MTMPWNYKPEPQPNHANTRIAPVTSQFVWYVLSLQAAADLYVIPIVQQFGKDGRYDPRSHVDIDLTGRRSAGSRRSPVPASEGERMYRMFVWS